MRHGQGVPQRAQVLLHSGYPLERQHVAALHEQVFRIEDDLAVRRGGCRTGLARRGGPRARVRPRPQAGSQHLGIAYEAARLQLDDWFLDHVSYILRSNRRLEVADTKSRHAGGDDDEPLTGAADRRALAGHRFDELFEARGNGARNHVGSLDPEHPVDRLRLLDQNGFEAIEESPDLVLTERDRTAIPLALIGGPDEILNRVVTLRRAERSVVGHGVPFNRDGRAPAALFAQLRADRIETRHDDLGRAPRAR